MIGINNTSTTKTKGKRRFHASLLTPSLLGNYAMSTSTTNGYYNISAVAIATIVGHDLAGTSSGATIGQARVYVYNVTQKRVEAVTIPLRFFTSIGFIVFFNIGEVVTTKNLWNNLGLTMPSSGDSMKLSVALQLAGCKPVGGWKQTWTAS